MNSEELNTILEKHHAWLRHEPNGERADLRGADLSGAKLRDANLRLANLRDTDLRDTDLRGADLRYIVMNWTSHALIGEILWRAAGTIEQEMLAAFIGRKESWCWSKWATFPHPEREWALATLRNLVKADDGAPDILQATEKPA